MGIASIEGIVWSSFYIAVEFFKITVNDTVTFLITIVTLITVPTVLGLLIRFERVQVQLRAQEENNIKIIEAIKRANILQIVFIITLLAS